MSAQFVSDALLGTRIRLSTITQVDHSEWTGGSGVNRTEIDYRVPHVSTNRLGRSERHIGLSERTVFGRLAIY